MPANNLPGFIDLFAGIGGLRLALEAAGFPCVFSSEWDKFSAESYKENFGEQPAGDVREVSSMDIPDFDILAAGFPCTPFSISGVSKRNSMGLAHGFLDRTQGTLFFEIARILKDRRPRALLLENVKNLLRHDKGRTFEVIRATLEDELGYRLYVRVFNSSGLVPQNRERTIIVGFREAEDFDRFRWPSTNRLSLTKPPRLRDILEKTVHDKYTLSDKLWSYLQSYKEKHQKRGNGFGFGLADLDGITRTLSARYYKDGSEILVPQSGKNPRRLTPRECARLMGFPDSFRIVVSDTQAYKQFGNSIVVPLFAEVANQLAPVFRNADLRRSA